LGLYQRTKDEDDDDWKKEGKENGCPPTEKGS
jgi:hypothetical protein